MQRKLQMFLITITMVWIRVDGLLSMVVIYLAFAYNAISGCVGIEQPRMWKPETRRAKEYFDDMTKCFF